MPKYACNEFIKGVARLDWCTVEFGLIETATGLKVYGAEILSSGSEIRHAVEHPTPRRLTFDLLRVMRSDDRIDRMQDTYFVIDGFAQRFDATAPCYERLRGLSTIAADRAAEGDRGVVPRGDGDVTR